MNVCAKPVHRGEADEDARAVVSELSSQNESDMMNHSLRFASVEEWSSVARRCPEYSFQQSPAYSLEIAKRSRAKCEFICVGDARDVNNTVALASVRVGT